MKKNIFRKILGMFHQTDEVVDPIELITVHECAERLGFWPGSIANQIGHGMFQADYIDGKTMIRWDTNDEHGRGGYSRMTDICDVIKIKGD